MSNKVKGINIKNWTYYFFNDIIDIENFDPNNIKINKKSKKYSYLLYWICENLYLIFQLCSFVTIFRYVNRYFKESNRNKYLTLFATNENKEENKKVWRTAN